MSKLLKKFKRSVAIVLSITTFAWALGPVALLMPTQVLAAEAKAGDLIKMNGLSSVYYLGADSKRYVFPNETTFKSWYGDFSSVKTIAQSELESYSLGSNNATIRPGTKLVKITTNPKVYAVEDGGILKAIPDEATAKTLYGADWAKRVVDVPDAFFMNYTKSDEQVSATAYPKGTLIKYAGSADIYVVDSATTARKIASTEAMTANRYKDADVVTAPSTIVYTSGTAVTAAESALVDLSKTGVTPTTSVTTAAGTVTVSLSSATAGAATVIATQAIADLASFNFKAGDADVKVTSVKVKRTGVSADTTLANVYLYDGATRLTDNASVSSGYITWNNSTGIFTIPKNTTRTITVKSDIANVTGQTVGVSINAATDITSDATVSGTFPMNGNLMSIASAGTFASIVFSAADVILPAVNTSVSAQNDFELWKDPSVDIGNGPVDLYSVRFRQIGSVLADDVKNFKLYVDGVKQGATIEKVDSSGYIEFDLTAAPLHLDKSVFEMKVLADLIDGSTRTTSLSLRQAADIVIKDSEYNANIRATAGGTTSFSAVSSGLQTIAGGTLTITKTTDSKSGDVVDGASGVSLGKFEFKAAGESIKVETLRISVAVSDANVGRLRNGKILANGIQVGSTADIYDNAYTGSSATTIYTDYTLGSSLIVVPGSPKMIEIVSDIYDNDGTTDDVSADDTIQARIEVLANNAQKMDSLSYFNGPATAVTGNSLTVKTGSLSLAKATSYANHNVVAPKTAYKLGEWNLTAATTEVVNLTSLVVTFAGTGAMDVPSKISDGYLKYGSDTTSVKSAVATSTNTWTLSKSIATGATINVALYGTIASGTTGGATPTLTVNATTASSGTSSNSSATEGQTTTWTTGSITTATMGTPLNQIVYGGQTVTAATYEINPTNDTYTLEEVCVKVASGAQAAIDKVYLYDGTTLLNTGGTVMNGVYATTTGLTLSMPANTTKTLTVKLGLNNIGTSAAAPGLNAAVTLDTIVVRNSNGTKSYVSTDRAGNEVYVYKAYPVVTYQELSSRKIINGSSQDIYKFKIAPSANGTIAVKQMKFTLGWTDLGTLGGALALGSLKFYRGSTDISANVEITNAAGTSVKSGTSLLETDQASGLVIGFKNSEELITAETSYTIKATPAAFDSGTTSSDSVSITMIGDDATSGTKKYALDTVSLYKIWKLATDTSGSSATAYNFIWSDKSATPHSAASTTSSADWANGYLVDFLNLDATVMDANP